MSDVISLKDRQPRREIKVARGDDFVGKPVPARPFHVPELVPGDTVTMLGGDGGTGKSLLALQLAVSTALDLYWCGLKVTPGPVIYVSAEDDEDEIHRRLVAICNREGVGLDALTELRIILLAGEDAIMAAPDSKTALLKRTLLADRIEDEIKAFAPALVVFDTLADLFGGQENDRAQARQFIGMLRGWAIRYRLAALLLSHPSLTGMSTGSGLSGSTAWNNSVRSRLYLDRVRGEDGFEADPDLRILKTLKSNYGPTGGEIRLR